jgi:hypothetical protein
MNAPNGAHLKTGESVMAILDVSNSSSFVTTGRESAPRASRHIGRRVGAVLAGLVANAVLASALDGVLHATRVYPPVGQQMAGGLFLLAFAYRIAFGIGGSYLTARLAPDRPVQHALVLGVVGVVISAIGAIVMWDAGPAWYSLGILASALPTSWIGGQLRARQLRAR